MGYSSVTDCEILALVITVNTKDVTPKATPHPMVSFLKKEEPDGVEKITSPLEPKIP